MKDKLDFENKESEIINSLTDFKDDFKLKDGVKKMAKRKINEKTKGSRVRTIPAIGVALMVCICLAAVSALAFPNVATKYASALPIVQQLNEKDQDLTNLSEKVTDMKNESLNKDQQISNLENEIEELKIQMKEISKENIKEVETSENNNEALNIQLQTLVVNFVKAMYREEYDTAAAYCTEDFGKQVKKDPQYIVRKQENAVVFTQITNIAKTEDGKYLVFLRLNSDKQEADYQINFHIIETDGEYYITFAGMDA